MENASKALLMVAAVLVGVMLLSIGVYLFSIFGGFGAQISTQLEEKNINEFNSKFYQYQDLETCRVHDIVTVANLAKENNNNYEYTDTYIGPYYITVIVEGYGNKYKNFEKLSLQEYTDFIKANSLQSVTDEQGERHIQPLYFKCTNVEISSETKYVNSITFKIVE